MLNIGFPFGILMSENYTQRKKLYHGIWEIFTVWEQKLLTSCSKRLHMHNWDTILESQGGLDKTMYGESSVKVYRLHQS